jgi:hypothetical protein
MLLETRMSKGLKLPRTHYRLIGGALPVERKVIFLTGAPTHTLVLINQVLLHQPLPMVLTLFLLPPS